MRRYYKTNGHKQISSKTFISILSRKCVLLWNQLSTYGSMNGNAVRTMFPAPLPANSEESNRFTTWNDGQPSDFNVWEYGDSLQPLHLFCYVRKITATTTSSRFHFCHAIQTETHSYSNIYTRFHGTTFDITARVIVHTKVSGLAITYRVKLDLSQII